MKRLQGRARTFEDMYQVFAHIISPELNHNDSMSMAHIDRNMFSNNYNAEERAQLLELSELTFIMNRYKISFCHGLLFNKLKTFEAGCLNQGGYAMDRLLTMIQKTDATYKENTAAEKKGFNWFGKKPQTGGT